MQRPVCSVHSTAGLSLDPPKNAPQSINGPQFLHKKAQVMFFFGSGRTVNTVKLYSYSLLMEPAEPVEEWGGAQSLFPP